MLTEYQQSLTNRTIRKKTLFLVLSFASVVIGLGLAAYYTWEAITLPQFNIGVHAVLVTMILLNARQNLRQYHFAAILDRLAPQEGVTKTTSRVDKRSTSTL